MLSICSRSIFDGVYAFGFMGLFYDLIVLGVLRAVVSVFSREYAA